MASENSNATKAKISPLCLAVAGKYEGLDYDGITVIPLLEKEKILISVTVENDVLKTVAHIPFPAAEQTAERFQQILKSAIGHTLLVLL